MGDFATDLPTLSSISKIVTFQQENRPQTLAQRNQCYCVSNRLTEGGEPSEPFRVCSLDGRVNDRRRETGC